MIYSLAFASNFEFHRRAILYYVVKPPLLPPLPQVVKIIYKEYPSLTTLDFSSRYYIQYFSILVYFYFLLPKSVEAFLQVASRDIL